MARKTYNETEVANLGNVTDRYRARVIDTGKGERIIDIREYVESARFTGWTPKGIRIPDIAGIDQAIAVLTAAKEHMSAAPKQ